MSILMTRTVNGGGGGGEGSTAEMIECRGAQV